MDTLQNETNNNTTKSSSRLIDLKEILVEVAASYEFFYLLEGELLLHMNEKVQTLFKGDLFIANPGDAYMILPKEGSAFMLYLALEQNHNISQSKFYRYVTIARKDDLHYSPIHAMYKFYDDYMRMGEDQMATRQKYLIEKMKPLAYDATPYESKREKKIHMIQDAASQLYLIDSDASLDSIAEELGISPSYLSRVFKEVSGMGFSEYSQRKKLEISSSLLQEDLTIDKIATQTGFASTKSLNRIYNQLLNKTPSEYRKDLAALPKEETSQENLRKRSAFQKFSSQFSELSYGSAILESLGKDYCHHELSLSQPDFKRNTLGGLTYRLCDFGENYAEEIRKFHDDGRVSGIFVQMTIDEKKPNQVYLQDLNRWVLFNEMASIFELLESLKIPVGITMQVRKFSVIDACNQLNREALNRSIAVVEDFLEKFLQILSRPLAQNLCYVFDLSFILKLSDQRSTNLFSEYMERQHQVLERVLQHKDYKFAYVYGDQTSEELKGILEFITKNRHHFRIAPTNFYRLIMPNTIRLTESYQFAEAVELYKKNMEFANSLEIDPALTAFNMINEGGIILLEINDHSLVYQELIASILWLDHYIKLDPQENTYASYNFIFKDPIKMIEQTFEAHMVDFGGYQSPLYYFSENLNAMKGHVLYHKNGCMVTKDGEEFSILLYNHPLFDYSFAIEKGFEYLNQYSADITFEISGVQGSYKESMQLINYRHGPTAYHLQNFSDPNLLAPQEKDYVKRLSIPKMMSNFVEFHGTLTRTFSLAPFEVMFMRYTPV